MDGEVEEREDPLNNIPRYPYVPIKLFNIRLAASTWIENFFDCKKCPVHLVSFIKHDGLFVSYIVHNFFFRCLSCMSHDPRNIIFLTRKSWFQFLDDTESKNQWLKITILLGSVSVCSFPSCKFQIYGLLLPSFLHIFVDYDRLKPSIHTLYLVRQADPHGANHRHTYFLRSVL